MKHAQNPYILLLIAPLMWGGNVIVGRLAAGEISPFTLTALRWALTLLILIPFVIPSLRRDWVVIKQHYRLLFVYGMVGFSGFNMLLYAGLNYTTAINATLIQSSTPVIIILISHLRFKERFNQLQLIGLMFATLGVTLIVTAGKPQQLLQLSLNKGDAMILMCSLMYASFTLGLRYKPQMGSLSFIFVCSMGALLFCLPFSLYEVATRETVIQWSAKTAGLIIYAAIFASLLAQFTYIKGVGLLGASRAGLAINLIPVFGTLLAVIILHEAFHWYHLLALVLVLGGIAISEYSIKKIIKTKNLKSQI